MSMKEDRRCVYLHVQVGRTGRAINRGQSTSHSLLLIGNTNTGVQQYELMVTFTADPLFDLPLLSTQTMERSCLSHFGT